MADSGQFQINDIVLDIPPEQIRVDRRSINYKWQTLRTRSSIKTKSGFSNVDISLTVHFTDRQSSDTEQNGYEKLTNLISQFRVTPFCYVENEFIRRTMMGDNKNTNMALALKQVQITKSDYTTNVITVQFHFAWFNYFPYSHNFSFKKDIFLPQEVMDPSLSKAWKLMYEGEQSKPEWQEAKNIKSLSSQSSLEYWQYAKISTRQFEKLNDEVKAFKALQDFLSLHQQGEGDSSLGNKIDDVIFKSLQDKSRADAFIKDYLGHTTSHGNDNSSPNEMISEMLAVVSKNIDPNTTSKYSIIVGQGWEHLVDNQDKPLRFSDDILGMAKPDSVEGPKEKDKTLIMRRKQNLILGEHVNHKLFITGISVSFENILAAIPLIGHPYPTFQHIGSVDAVVTISMMTTSEEGLEAITQYYNMVEKQAYTHRLIPQGHRNIRVTDSIINLVGLRDFLPESITYDTVPGSPGTYAIQLVLCNNHLSPETTEELAGGQSFITTNDIRRKISKVITNKLKFNFKQLLKKNINDVEDARTLSARVGAQALLSVPLLAYNTTRYLQATPTGAGFYTFKESHDSGGRNQAFKDICEEYARLLSEKVENLFPLLASSDPIEAEAMLQVFLSLSDKEVIGIEKLQEDLLPALKNSSRATAVNSTLNGSGIDAIRNANRAALKADMQSLKNKIPTAVKQVGNAVKNLYQQKGNLESGIGALVGQVLQIREIDVNTGKTAGPRPGGTISNALYDVGQISEGSAVTKAFNLRVNFLSDYTRDWQVNVRNFLDRILQSGNFGLPEFKEVRDNMNNVFMSGSGKNAYPDFPLKEIASIIDIKGSFTEEYRYALELLKTEAENNEFIAKGLGIDSLIGPDFYFFNQHEVTGKLIPDQTMQKAIQVVRDNHEKRFEVENKFFENVYNQRFLGLKRVAKMGFDMGSITEAISKSLFGGSGDKIKKSIIKEYEELAASSSIFFEGDLATTGRADTGLMCSISEAKENGEDILISEINPNNSSFENLQNKLRPSETLQSLPHHAEIRHYPGKDSIEFKGSIPAGTSAQKLEPGVDPYFIHPMPTGWKRNSVFNPMRPRPDQVDRLKAQGLSTAQAKTELLIKASTERRTDPNNYKAGWDYARPHNGIDYGHATNRYNSKIKASAIGTIKSIQYSDNQNPDVTGYITLSHSNGWVTKYLHLQHNSILKEWRDKFKAAESIGKKVTVKQGDILGTMGSTGAGNAVHLHFETWKNGVAINPEDALGRVHSPGNEIPLTIDSNNQSLLTLGFDQVERDLITDQGYTMARAYPTFRLYFIESDMGERKRFGFDDFYNYSAVKEIQVVRNRKIAADLCLIQLTNISGALSNRKFKESKDSNKARGLDGKVAIENIEDPLAAGTTEENPFGSVMLQPGIQIQLRLGYNANPSELEDVFNGVITDVTFSETDDLVQIVCQSYAIELTQKTYGTSKKFGNFLGTSGATGAILEDLMSAPEVVHFGRWEKDVDINGGLGNGVRSLLTTRYTFNPRPQDDNIFAPSGPGLWGYYDKTGDYILHKSTIWDVFQEMTLRHPSYIACPVPYNSKTGEARMTMFFGMPDQLYFARDPGFREDNFISKIGSIVTKATITSKAKEELTMQQMMDPTYDLDTGQILETINKDIDNIKPIIKSNIDAALRKFTLDKGIIKPFRSYHVLTSAQHIIANNISVSSHDTFNTVTLQYSDTSAKIDLDKSTPDDLQVKFGNLKTITVKCDAALEDEDVQELFAQFPNCVGIESAKRYSIGLLHQCLKENYRGTIIISGNPRIKPHDVCYIYDEYSDMFGPIEVEQVVHKFSQQNGFITEITPDLAIHVNQFSSMSTLSAMGLGMEIALKNMGVGDPRGVSNTDSSIDADTAMTPVASTLQSEKATTGDLAYQVGVGALTLIGHNMLGMKKLITRTQLGHPFRFSPLMHYGKAMAALPTKKTNASFIEGIDNWLHEAAEAVPLYMEDFFDRIHPSSWLGHSRGYLLK